LLFSKNKFEDLLWILALGKKTLEKKIGFDGETIHPSWPWRKYHLDISLWLSFHHLAIDFSLLEINFS